MPAVNDQSIIFIHIPKTAGTTLRSIIEDLFPREQLYFLYIGNTLHPGMEEFQALSEEEKRRIKIFCGHQAYGFHRYLPQPCKYITVMRDPIERTVSLYHHLLQEKHARHDQSVADIQKIIKSENLSLERFVASGITVDTDNAQTRILSGESPDFGQCSRETLEKAKKNLREHFIVTGLTERFDETVMLIHKILGWPTPYYRKQNVAAGKREKADLPSATLDTIHRFNEFDSELYNFARELFEEQIKRQGASFANEVEYFKVANANRQLQARIDELTNSWSWKITGPMRKAVDMMKNLK